MVQQLSLFTLPAPPDAGPPESRRASPGTSPPAHRPTAPEDQTAAAGTPSRVAYRCYAPRARGDRIERTLAAALTAFRARTEADPSHVAAHPEDVAALTAATSLPVLPQQACPRGQVRLALP